MNYLYQIGYILKRSLCLSIFKLLQLF